VAELGKTIGRRCHDTGHDGGSASAELVLLAPVIVALLGILFAAGRVVLVRESLGDAARTAAESAVVASDAAGARAAAASAAARFLGRARSGCSDVAVRTDTADFAPAGFVAVRVTCDVEIGRLAFLPFPGSFRLAAGARDGIEPFREIGP
jgi:hypothetical protein